MQGMIETVCCLIRHPKYLCNSRASTYAYKLRLSGRPFSGAGYFKNHLLQSWQWFAVFSFVLLVPKKTVCLLIVIEAKTVYRPFFFSQKEDKHHIECLRCSASSWEYISAARNNHVSHQQNYKLLIHLNFIFYVYDFTCATNFKCILYIFFYQIQNTRIYVQVIDWFIFSWVIFGLWDGESTFMLLHSTIKLDLLAVLKDSDRPYHGKYGSDIFSSYSSPTALLSSINFKGSLQGLVPYLTTSSAWGWLPRPKYQIIYSNQSPAVAILIHLQIKMNQLILKFSFYFFPL